MALPVDLSWSAPAECPTREVVLVEVARLCDRPPPQTTRASVRAEVTRGQDGLWRAVLHVDAGGAHAERPLEAESCDAIASAAALIIALAVEGSPPEPEPEPHGAPAPVPSPDAPTTVAAASTSPSSARRPTAAPLDASSAAPPARVRDAASQLDVAASAVFDGGDMPALATGVEAALGWRLQVGRWRARALASGDFFPPETTQPAGAPAQGRFWMIAATMRACASLRLGGLDVGPCLGAEIDVMSATGVGQVPSFMSQSQTAAWSSLLGSALGSWGLSGSFGVFVRGDAVVPVAPPQFVIDQRPLPHILVHRPAYVGARAAVGIEVSFF